MTNGGASAEHAEVQPAGSGSTSSVGEAMDCDDDYGRDCVGVTETRRRDKRVVRGSEA